MSISMDDSQLATRTVELRLEQGLHLRVCSHVVSIATPFAGTVRIHNGDRVADATSMFELLQLVAVPGAELVVEVHGSHPEQVLNQLEALFSGQVDY